MSVFAVKQGDGGPPISVRLTESDGSPVDLTGRTVTFRMVAADTPYAVRTEAAAAIVGAPGDGITSYTWQTADFAVAGVYLAEWKVTGNGLPDRTYPGEGYNLVLVSGPIGTPVGAVMLSDIERLTGQDFTAEQTLRVMRLVESLTDALELHLNRVLYRRQFTETAVVDAWGRLVLNRGPVVSIDAISYAGGIPFVLPTYVNVEAYGALTPGLTFDVTYTAGDLPSAAVRDLLATAVSRTVSAPTAVASGAIRSYSVEGTSITYGDVSDGGQGGAGRFTVAELRGVGRKRRPVLL